MALNLADRLATVAVTATLTSAAWIVFGSGFARLAEEVEPVTSDGAAAVPAASPSSAAVGAAPVPITGDLAIPVAGVAADQLVDTFTDERGGGERLHEALDIMAPEGTPVVAAAPGTIEKLFHSAAGGNTIYLRSADRQVIHYYAHLRGYAPGLKEGQQVARSERLGDVGYSGNASPTAPHLHFAILRTQPDAEWWEPATAIDPYPLLGGK